MCHLYSARGHILSFSLECLEDLLVIDRNTFLAHELSLLMAGF